VPYSINQHKHNFALWTAARAAQRGYTSTKVIGKAIDASYLASFAIQFNINSQKEFHDKHKEIANQIINSLKDQTGSCSYGRAAKIIAIYLKTFVILDQSINDKGVQFIHPPVDSILLKNLHNERDKSLKLNKCVWTKLEEAEYFELIHQLKPLVPEGKPFWYLEKHWSPSG
tara:strand:- start:13422 stop:13937 length:516 start_codon:yes stop_codon:yes gene_type:complete